MAKPVLGDSTTYTDKRGKPLAQNLSVEELLAAREQIDALLPKQSLKGLDLERELILQLRVVKRLQDETGFDSETPANQRAQVAGQVANVLVQLSKLQTEVYTSERLKKAEMALIEVLNTLPDAAKEAFLTEYERVLEHA